MAKIQPDVGFVKRIVANGGKSLKKCYQCATCSVVCNLSPDQAPFPRKEMVWSQWGLKDRLVADHHVWMCYQCNDCSTRCPRGAKPGDVMSGVRSAVIHHFATPGFMATIASRPLLLPVLFAIPIIVLYALIKKFGYWGIPTGEVHYAAFFPHIALEGFFGLASMVTVLIAAIGVFRFWKALDSNYTDVKDRKPLIQSAMETLFELLKHRRFDECDESLPRRTGHLFIFYAFLTLLFVTAIVAVLAQFGLYPLTLWHPLKVMGNLGAIALLVGCALVIMERMRAADKGRIAKGSYFDWLFLIIVLLTAVTGVTTEFFRFAYMPVYAYPSYFAHLTLVFILILFFPFTKFAHFFYRFTALTHARVVRLLPLNQGGQTENQG